MARLPGTVNAPQKEALTNPEGGRFRMMWKPSRIQEQKVEWRWKRWYEPTEDWCWWRGVLGKLIAMPDTQVLRWN